MHPDDGKLRLALTEAACGPPWMIVPKISRHIALEFQRLKKRNEFYDALCKANISPAVVTYWNTSSENQSAILEFVGALAQQQTIIDIHRHVQSILGQLERLLINTTKTT